MRPKRNRFDPKRLYLVARAVDFYDSREPPLYLGNRVQLNSGGPISLVVDIDIETVTVAWNGAEAVFPRPCVHRVRD
jgi:hypothetical protein